MEIIASYLGKTILIGLTVLASDNSVIGKIETHGVITKLEGEYLVIKRSNDQPDFRLPFAPNYISSATPGEYRLRTTGEVVTNPDFLTTWDIHAGKERSLEDIKQHGFVPKTP
ncbi:MAG TPA: hypothetical protein VM532_01805 [Burkholderiales bacterium]|jgi:hypothetical protein|nr:hypothetical protein [Burkholderiales bacterium]